MIKRIIIGSDHAGLGLKNGVKDYLTGLGYDVLDVGTNDKQSCHYPDFAKKMASVMKNEDRGILICGSGIGICIAANKCGISCGTAYNEYTAAECGKQFQAMAMG
jgi:ribose 5-phosphate isomerase B